MPKRSIRRPALYVAAMLVFCAVSAVPVATHAARRAVVASEGKFFSVAAREPGKKFRPLARDGKFYPLRNGAAPFFVEKRQAVESATRPQALASSDPHTLSQLDQGEDDLSNRTVTIAMSPSVPALAVLPSVSAKTRAAAPKERLAPASLEQPHAQAIYELFLAEDGPRTAKSLR